VNNDEGRLSELFCAVYPCALSGTGECVGELEDDVDFSSQ